MGIVTSVLFDGEISIQYRFAFVQPEDDEYHDEFGIDGQRNGLCGAGIPGVLSLTFGLHTGSVPIRIEALTAAPHVPSDDAWDEVVEASFTAETTAYLVAAFEDFYSITLPASGTYRVRYSASGMDAAAEADTRDEGDKVIDR